MVASSRPLKMTSVVWSGARRVILLGLWVAIAGLPGSLATCVSCTVPKTPRSKVRHTRSHASPTPLWLVSSWLGLYTFGQLSQTSGTPS